MATGTYEISICVQVAIIKFAIDLGSGILIWPLYTLKSTCTSNRGLGWIWSD
jgi:hypothetical protein